MAPAETAQKDKAQATQDEGGNAQRETKAQLIANRIMEVLKEQEDNSMESSKLHEQMQKEFGTSGLYGARQILGDKVQTGNRVNGKSHWKLVNA